MEIHFENGRFHFSLLCDLYLLTLPALGTWYFSADQAMGHRVEWVAFWMDHLGHGSVYVHP